MVDQPTPNAIGDLIRGKITRIVSYGAFLEFPNGQNGLLHISEVSEKFVRDIHSFLSVGDEVTVRVISVDPGNNYLRLSMKNIPNEVAGGAKSPAKKKRVPIPENQVDFTKLKEMLPQWIEQTLKENK